MKIGFYGSSLCANIDSRHSIYNKYETYIEKLKKHYNANICHLGIKGCSSWDVILIQYKELLKDLPDVAIFIWPINHTLYNTRYRTIHKFSLAPNSKLAEFDQKLWQSVSLYYRDLFDIEKDILETKSALYYFDNKILSELDKKVKVIHLWEHGVILNENFDFSNSKFIENVEYPIAWTNGFEIKGSLISLSAAGQWPRRPNFEKIFTKDPRCNHIEGDYKNTLLFEWIKDSIDNYQNECKIDKTKDIVEVYTKLSLGVAPVGGL